MQRNLDSRLKVVRIAPVDNTKLRPNCAQQMRDPFDCLNPYAGLDDGLTAAFVSPLIFEIDVIAVPEPTTLALLGLGALLRLRRRQLV